MARRAPHTQESPQKCPAHSLRGQAITVLPLHEQITSLQPHTSATWMWRSRVWEGGSLCQEKGPSSFQGVKATASS